MEFKMKRIIAILLAAMALALPLASCAGNSEVTIPDGMVLASGEDSAYYLFVPQNWKMIAGYGTYGGSATDGSNVVVSTYTEINLGEDGTTAASTTAGAAEAAAETTAETTDAETAAPEENLTGAEKYIAEYWSSCKESFAKELKDFNIESEGKATKLDGKAARKYVYTATADGVKYKMQMTVTYSGGLIYIVTYTATENNYETHTSEVDKILTEFKFK